MSDHILRDENGNIILAVVHQETNTKEFRVQSSFQKVGLGFVSPDEVRQYRAGPRLRLYGFMVR